MAILAQLQKRQYAVLPLGAGSGAATSAPFGALEEVNRLLRENPSLVDQINAETPGGKWPNVKTAALERLEHPKVDLKVPFDMSPERFAKLGAKMTELLGKPFEECMHFFNESLGRWKTVIDQELAEITSQPVPLSDTENWRMVDYFPLDTAARGPRCGKHRDYGSYTLIVADQPGLEIFDEVRGIWVDVYESSENAAAAPFIVVIPGYVLEILSGGKVRAALHRVVQKDWARRMSFCLFCAPLKTQLVAAGLTVSDLKTALAPKWRHREGNCWADEYDEGSQDAIVAALRAKQAAIGMGHTAVCAGACTEAQEAF